MAALVRCCFWRESDDKHKKAISVPRLHESDAHAENVMDNVCVRFIARAGKHARKLSRLNRPDDGRVLANEWSISYMVLQKPPKVFQAITNAMLRCYV
jgi:hypothetical protein